jgi:hypothetical protein
VYSRGSPVEAPVIELDAGKTQNLVSLVYLAKFPPVLVKVILLDPSAQIPVALDGLNDTLGNVRSKVTETKS